MKNKFKKALALCVACMLFLSMLPIQFAAAKDNPYKMNVSEKEAYQKGYDYYKAWYIINKGYYWEMEKMPRPYLRAADRSGFEADYLQWKMMTFDISGLTSHSDRETAFIEAMLFNMICGDGDVGLFADAAAGYSDVASRSKAVLEQIGIEAWEGIAKLSADFKETSSMGDITEEERDKLLDAAGLGKGFELVADAMDIMENTATLGDLINNLIRVQYCWQVANEMSEIFAEMLTVEQGDTPMAAALRNLYELFSDMMTPEKAAAIYLAKTTVRQFRENVVDAMWKFIGKHVSVFKYIQMGVAIGKFLSNGLTGIDARFDASERVACCYETEVVLYNAIDHFWRRIREGDVFAARLFNASFGLMKSTLLNNIEEYLNYADVYYKQGVINWVFPGINGDKYNKAVEECSQLREAIDQYMAQAVSKAERDYAKCVKKYDPDKAAPEPLELPTIDKIIDKIVKIITELPRHFCLVVKGEDVLQEDLEVWGGVFVMGGTLKLNGHSLTVYGDLGVTWSGVFDVLGQATVTGCFRQTGGSVSVAGASTLSVGGDYLQKGGYLTVQGTSSVGGRHVIGENDDWNEAGLYIRNGGSHTVGKDLLGYGTNESGEEYVQIEVENGTLTAQNTVRIIDGMITGSSKGTVRIAGAGDVRVQNVTDVNLEILNAAKRKITMAKTVTPVSLQGGAMTVTPENLRFGSKLNGDVTFTKAFTVGGYTDLNGHNLKVNGDLNIASGVTVKGKAEVTGKVTQTGGSVSVAGASTLSVGGDYLQKGGYLTVQGTSSVGGRHVIGENDDWNEAGLYIRNGGSHTVGKDLLGYGTNESGEEYVQIEVENGTLTAQNTVRIIDGMVTGSSKGTVRIAGAGDVRVQNVTDVNLEILNAAKRKITLAKTVTPVSLQGGAMTVTPDNLQFGGKLNGDVTFTKTFTVGGYTDLNGHSITVEGDLVHSYGEMVINGGALTVTGNYLMGTESKGSSGSLRMAKSADRVTVQGNMVVNSYNSSTLLDGVLTIGGHFTQLGTEGSFRGEKNHQTVLDGKGLQRVKFENAPTSMFHILVLKQSDENYDFKPEPCWDKLVRFCAHEETELRNAVEPTCTEDGYSGDRYCLLCGVLVEKGVVVNAPGHQAETIPAVPATCAAPGKTTGSRCSVCGKVFREPVDTPKDPANHTGETERRDKKPATSEQEGYTGDLYCVGCGALLQKGETIPKLPDDRIESDQMKQIDDNTVVAQPGQTAEELLEEAPEGSSLLSPDGQAYPDQSTVGSGAVLETPDGIRLTIIVMGDNDSDGIITPSDARLALRRSVRLEIFAEWQDRATKVDGASEVSSAQARMILRASVGLEDAGSWFAAVSVTA